MLRIGPGPRLDRVAALVEALSSTLAGAPALSRFADTAELLLLPPRDRVVLDADLVPVEDVGLVRRFLAHRPHASVEALGSDRTTPAGRALLALPRTRWHPWPLELVHLDDLLRGPPAAQLPHVPPAPAAGETASPAEPRDFDWRAPLADLALQVRRTGEMLLALRSGGALDPAASESLGGELLRLERSVRTLSLGAERGGRKDEELDLDALVEQELAVLALQTRRAPRVRYQGGEPLTVRADRALLVHAVGVLLDLVRTLAGAGELVEVRSLSAATDAGPVAIVRLRAPAGALAGLAPAQLLQAAGLGERLPGIGASELFVLARLCASRGIGLEGRGLPGTPPLLELELALPLAARAPGASGEARGPGPGTSHAADARAGLDAGLAKAGGESNGAPGPGRDPAAFAAGPARP